MAVVVVELMIMMMIKLTLICWLVLITLLAHTHGSQVFIICYAIMAELRYIKFKTLDHVVACQLKINTRLQIISRVECCISYKFISLLLY